MRFKFLPTFFAALALVFGMAVFLRVRAYTPRDVRIDAPASATFHDETRPAAPVSDTGEIIPVAEDGVTPSAAAQTQGSAPTTTAAQTRAERFNALLRAALPQSSQRNAAAADKPAEKNAVIAPPAPPQPAPKPNLLTRMVNAVTGRDNAPPQTHAQAGRAPATDPNRGSSSERGERENKPGERDPSSDTMPPQLLGIEFVPPQVRDGEETQLVVLANDDLSGIRNISGSIASPSGALQGFACNRETPDGTRWIARIAVPKDAAEGVWRVNYISLMDNASNSVNLGGNMGGLPASASFRVVSSRPDSTGPTLRGIRLDRIAMKAGEANKVYVMTEDDKSGVALVSGVFQSPSATARIGFGCRMGGSGEWECDLTPPTCLDCGEWKLEQIQLQDKANNMTTLRLENQLVQATRLHISAEMCDNGLPTISLMQLDRNVVSNADTSTITVTATVTDDVCGVASLSGQVMGPSSAGGPRLYVSFTPGGDGTTWTGRLVVPRLAAKGMWQLSWMQVLDKGHNLKTYSQGEQVLTGATFQVQ